jgi:hypothetical protein
MSSDEVAAIFKAKTEVDKSIWERTRLVCYYNVIAMIGNKEIKTPKDLFPFSWEKEESEKAERLTRDEFLEKAKKLL